MKKKSLFLVLLLFVLAQKDFAQDTVSYSGTFSLKQCVEMALKNNIDVNRSDLLMQDSKVSLSNARGNRLPFVSGFRRARSYAVIRRTRRTQPRKISLDIRDEDRDTGCRELLGHELECSRLACSGRAGNETVSIHH